MLKHVRQWSISHRLELTAYGATQPLTELSLAAVCQPEEGNIKLYLFSKEKMVLMLFLHDVVGTA